MKTMKDISKITGLSKGTISRYINKNGYVSEKSAKLIQKAIEELDYVPNQHARALYNKSTKVIGLIVPSLINPFFSQMATIIENKLITFDYNIILYNTNDNIEEEIKALNMLRGFRVDGIVIGRSQNKELIKNLDIPIVSFESDIGGTVANITADNYLGGEQAFNTLFERGCRKMLHIRGPKYFEATEARYKGFIDMSKRHNCNVDVVILNNDFEMGFDIGSALKNVNIRSYDGIFAFNDIGAAMIMSYLLKNGVSIPEDIQIVGFDNSYLSELLNPKLTTIEQPVEKIAEECIKVLLKRIDGEPLENTTIRISTKVILRDSTKNK